MFGTLVAACAFATGAGTADAASVQVCCAWNAELADGTLTYSVEGGTAQARDVVRDAVDEWDAELTALTLTEVTGRGANVPIKFKKGGGTTAGSTKRSLDRFVFVKGAAISIASSSFGLTNDLATIELVALHEFGHALGLGHTDEQGWLMSPVLSDGFPGIASCDVEGVRQANHWYFVDNAAAPHHPHVNSVDC